METKEIIRHRKPYHLDDFLAVSMLKAMYPDAEVKELHPQNDKEEIEEAKRDSSKILVDIGMDYNPEKRNYDHHQDEKLPSSVRLVMENEVDRKILKEIEQNEDLKLAIEIIDKMDREGFPKVSKEYGIKPNILTRTILTTLLQNPYDEEIGEKLLNNPERFNRQNFEKAVEEVRTLIEDNKEQILKDIEEQMHLTSEEKKMVEEQVEKLISAGDEVKDAVKSSNETYTGFVYQATVEGKAKESLISNLENVIKQEIENQRLLKQVKTLEIDGLKVGILVGDKPLPPPALFSKGYDIAVVPNTMNPNDISVVKNTASPKTEGIDVKGIAEQIGEVKFTHPTGFISVVDGSNLKVNKEEILQVVEDELRWQLRKQNKSNMKKRKQRKRKL
jgi:hypothetical protein